MPLASEEMWRGLTGGRSVHLESWPDAAEFNSDPGLVRDMDAIRDAASVALSLRKSAGLRVRLPLAELTLAVSSPETVAGYSDLLADELNVKRVNVVHADEETARKFGLEKAISINARALGPRLGKDVQRVIAQSKQGNWSVTGDKVIVDGTELFEGEYEITMVASGEAAGSAVGLTATGFVLLNTQVTEELEAEGLARDAVRHIQQARKDADLDVSDRISLEVVCDQASVAALETHREFVASETLALEFKISAGDPSGELTVGQSGKIAISLHKVG